MIHIMDMLKKDEQKIRIAKSWEYWKIQKSWKSLSAKTDESGYIQKKDKSNLSCSTYIQFDVMTD